MLTLAFSCHNRSSDALIEHQSNKRVEVTKIRPSDYPTLINQLENTLYSQMGNGRIQAPFGEVNLDEALKVEHFFDGVVRYTFLVESEKVGTTINLVLRVAPDEHVTGYQLIYQPDEAWAQQYTVSKSLQDFTGSVILADLNGIHFVERIFKNGLSYEYVDLIYNTNGRTTCDEGDGSGSGGSGDTGGGTGDGSSGDGSGSGDGGGSSGSGSSGSGSSGSGSGGGDAGYGCVWEVSGSTVTISCPLEDDWIARTSCAGTLPESDNECQDEECPPAPVGIIIPPIQDWPKTDELNTRFGDSFKEEFVNDLMELFENQTFTPTELSNFIIEFNYGRIIDSELEWFIRPLTSRFRINDSDYYTPFDLVPLFHYDYHVTNPGYPHHQLLEFYDSDGNLIQMVITFELAFPG